MYLLVPAAQVVPDKGLLNSCVSACLCVCVCVCVTCRSVISRYIEVVMKVLRPGLPVLAY